MLSLYRSKLTAKHLRKGDKNRKKRLQKVNQKQSAVMADARQVIAHLRADGRSKLATLLEWQLRIDPLSFDLANGIRAAKILLAGNTEQAESIMRGVIGVFEPEVLDAPLRHGKPYRESSGVEHRPTAEFLDYREVTESELKAISGTKFSTPARRK